MTDRDGVYETRRNLRGWRERRDWRPPAGGPRPEAWHRLGARIVKRLLPVVLVAATVAACTSAPSTSGSQAGAAEYKPGDPVEIGLPFPANLVGLAALFGGALGSSGAAPPTDAQTKAFYQAVVDHVNSNGGLLGSKIKPVYYSLDATSVAGTSAEQKMCTQFTQDHHVFAVMALQNHSDTLVSCLQAAGSLMLDPAGPAAVDDTFFTQHPRYAAAGALSLTKVAAVQVNGLWQAGFFSPGAKVGLVGYNSAPFLRAIDQVLKPALASHGLTVADQQLIAPVSGVKDAGPAQQAISNAVLRFKAKGIDHVLFFDSLGGTLSPWTRAAAAQKYHPRLGFTTNENPASRAFKGNKTNPDQVNQFAKALAVGWFPKSDVLNPPVNATGVLCNKIMGEAGASAAQAQFFWGVCDQLLTLAAGVKAGGKLTATAALAGLSKASSVPSAELLGPPSYAGGRRDGVATARILSFSLGCECFQYTGANQLPASLFEKG